MRCFQCQWRIWDKITINLKIIYNFLKGVWFIINHLILSERLGIGYPLKKFAVRLSPTGSNSTNVGLTASKNSVHTVSNFLADDACIRVDVGVVTNCRPTSRIMIRTTKPRFGNLCDHHCDQNTGKSQENEGAFRIRYEKTNLGLCSPDESA